MMRDGAPHKIFVDVGLPPEPAWGDAPVPIYFFPL
jgi:hypothetical protein